MSNNVQKCVLLEINPAGAKAIGIYSYTNAVLKRDEMSALSTINRYQIDGPFNVNIKEDSYNPFDLPQIPSIKPIFPKTPTIINSPRSNVKNPFHE